ncbi:unnamed protein product [Rotaria sp. Silwood2]|nr:unnamed protein product [Rotaria sp. Silwood2]
MTLNKSNETTILIAVITNNNWFEIYSSIYLHKEPLLSLRLHSPAKIHVSTNGTFILPTNIGSLCLIVQQTNANVASMKAENYFLVLAMNDRRLFTLMTADPIAPDLQEKIQILPSRTLQQTVKSATVKLVEHIQACADMNSSDEDDDDDNNENDAQTTQDSVINPIKKTVRPVSSLRFVTRLNGRHSQAKTNTVNGTLLKFIELFSKNVKSIDVKQLVHDSDEENHDNNLNVDLPIATNDHQYIEDDLNDIRQKHWNMISNK